MVDDMEDDDGVGSGTRASPVEITGAVDVGGVSSERSETGDGWRLTVTFVAWRVDDGPVREEFCTLETTVTGSQRDEYRESIEAETIITVRAWLDTASDARRATLDGVVETDVTDHELRRRLETYLHPDTFEDDEFGVFEADLGGFVTEAVWKDTAVELVLETSTATEAESALDVAATLWAEQSTWSEKFREAAADWASDIDWIDDADAFARSLRLGTVTVSPDRNFTFWYDDGFVDSGHGINVSGTIPDGPTRVTMVG